jgi:hypothetical protein
MLILINIKQLEHLGGVDHNGTIAGFGGEIVFHSGNWRSTNAITSLKFFPQCRNIFFSKLNLRPLRNKGGSIMASTYEPIATVTLYYFSRKYRVYFYS